MLFNKIYTPIFEKQKVVKAHQRSVLQLMTVLSRNRIRLLSIILNVMLKHIRQWMKNILSPFMLNTSIFK